MFTAARARRALTFAAVAAAFAAVPAQGAIVINEVDSDPTDFFELKNTDAAPVDIGGFVAKDSNDANSFTIPLGTVIAPAGYYSATPGFGLSSGDAVRLFAPADLVTPIDSFTWAAHAGASYGRCPDGSGPIGQTSAVTQDAANSCPVAAAAWPGGTSIATADALGTFGSNLSGLAYEPSGTVAPGVLWAVQNGPSTLYRLRSDGTTWAKDPANGWAAGKTLRFPDGLGVPDAEGVTLAGGDANAIYVSIERNDEGGASGTSRPAILRYDTSGAATTLNATREFDLTADIPGLPANGGLESITWVPDSVLTAKGFKDEATGAAYTPTTYPNHGQGVFVVGIEGTGELRAYALNLATGGATRVATFPSGFPKVMALEFEAETNRLWAVCDDSCNGRSATLDVAQTGVDAGRFRVSATYERPAGMPDLNNEGFAIAPQAECTAARKSVFWADDSVTGGHALRAGTLGCTVPAAPGGGTTPGGGGTTPGGGGTTPGGATAPVDPGPGTTPPPPAAPVVVASTDRAAPRVTLAALTRNALRNLRRTGRFSFGLTLNERATLTITATARRTARSRARRLLRTTRRDVRAGKRTFALTLSRKVRRTVRRRELLTVTVVARDPAGNVTTRRVTARVP